MFLNEFFNRIIIGTIRGLKTEAPGGRLIVL